MGMPARRTARLSNRMPSNWMMADPERRHEQSDPEQEGVEPEPPGKRDDTGTGREEQHDPEQDGDDTTEDQQPFAAMPDQRDPGRDQQDTSNNGPDRDHPDEGDQR